MLPASGAGTDDDPYVAGNTSQAIFTGASNTIEEAFAEITFSGDVAVEGAPVFKIGGVAVSKFLPLQNVASFAANSGLDSDALVEITIAVE